MLTQGGTLSHRENAVAERSTKQVHGGAGHSLWARAVRGCDEHRGRTLLNTVELVFEKDLRVQIAYMSKGRNQSFVPSNAHQVM